MRACEICKKKSIIQKSGVHQYGGAWAKRATKKSTAWLPNLHYAKVMYHGIRQTMRLCTKCLRRVKAASLIGHSERSEESLGKFREESKSLTNPAPKVKEPISVPAV